MRNAFLAASLFLSTSAIFAPAFAAGIAEDPAGRTIELVDVLLTAPAAAAKMGPEYGDAEVLRVSLPDGRGQTLELLDGDIRGQGFEPGRRTDVAAITMLARCADLMARDARIGLAEGNRTEQFIAYDRQPGKAVACLDLTEQLAMLFVPVGQ